MGTPHHTMESPLLATTLALPIHSTVLSSSAYANAFQHWCTTTILAARRRQGRSSPNFPEDAPQVSLAPWAHTPWEPPGGPTLPL